MTYIKHPFMDKRGAYRGLLPEVGVFFFFGVATGKLFVL